MELNIKRFVIPQSVVKVGDKNLAEIISMCLALSDFQISEDIYKQLPDKFKSYFIGINNY